MCGIACLFQEGLSKLPFDIWNKIVNDISRRGPDRVHQNNVDNLLLCGAVLHIQGVDIEVQPCFDCDGNILLWNGEVFGGIDIPSGKSDTAVVIEMLRQKLSKSVQEFSNKVEVLDVAVTFFSLIEGPFAFIYYHKLMQSVIYGRDRIGRRSLVTLSSSNMTTRHILISSNITHLFQSNIEQREGNLGIEVRELPVGGVFMQSVAPLAVDDSMSLPAWSFAPYKEKLPRGRDAICLQTIEDSSAAFLQVLVNVMSKRVKCLAEPSANGLRLRAGIAVLFSGGIDSVLLVRAWSYIPSHFYY